MLVRFQSLFASLLCLGVSSLLGAVVEMDPPPPRDVIVKFSGQGAAIDRARALKNSRSVTPLVAGLARQNAGGAGLARLELAPGIDVGEEVARLAANPAVEYVEPNYPLQLFNQAEPVVPNDFEFSRMYALRNDGRDGGKTNAHIHATEAWSYSTGSSNVVVAVIDTGIDYFHDDLRQNLWRNPGEIPGNGLDDDGNGYVDDVYGYDFVSGDSDPFDDNNHGTHVAGTIGAVGDNGIGTVGVCWKVSLMGLKAFNERGNGTVSSAIEAIHFAVANGARVINASWGLDEKSRALEEAVLAAADAGVLIIAAAGNGRTENFSYPAGYESVVAVGATDHKDARAGFSNFGDWVDLAAPGVSILSTLPENSYGPENGTSMAAPHVTGVAALVLSRFPDYSRDELRAILINSVDPIVTDRRIGNGRVNAAMAVRMDEPLPTAELTLPVQISGIVEITGSAFGRYFSGYSVNAKSGGAAIAGAWTTIASVSRPVTNGILAFFDSSGFGDGPVTVQLLVTNRNGSKAIAALESKILNTMITEPTSGDVLAPGRYLVRGHVVGTLGYDLSYGRGFNPTSWQKIASGTESGLNVELGTWNATDLADDFYTLRLTSSNYTGLTHFTAPLIYMNSRLKAGFPVTLPSGAEFPINDWRHVRAADLDNDGKSELILIDPATRERSQRLIVFAIGGQLLWSKELGYDLQPDMPAIADVDGDGKMEIFVDVPEGIMAFNHLGEPYSSRWPLHMPSCNHAKVLADVDDDGIPELVTLSQEYVSSQVQELRLLAVHKMDASLMSRWELPWCGSTNEVHKIYPVAADLNDRPGLEIIAPSGCNQLAAYSLDQPFPLWRAATGGALLSSPVIGDINGDGLPDVIVTGAPASGSKSGGIYVFDRAGRLWSGWPILEDHAFHASPALGDLDKDGRLEIVVPCRSHHEVHVIQHDGFEAEGWPLPVFGVTRPRGGVAIADVNGDAQPDILAAAPSITGLAEIERNNSYLFGMRAWDLSGEAIPLGNEGKTWLHVDNVGGNRWHKSAPPLVGDFDGNGRIDLVSASLQDRTYGSIVRFKDTSSVHAWELPDVPVPASFEWPMFNQNIQNLGVYPFPLVPAPNPTNVTLAVRDRLICPEDGTLLITALTNDLSAVSSTLTLDRFSQPDHGSLIREGEGALLYKPLPNYTGPDQFNYTIRDVAGGESTGVVLLKVKPVNDPPVARNLELSVNRNGSISIIYRAVDDEEADLDYRIVTPPEHGELWNYPALGVYYPHTGFTGVDSFTYVANDGLHDSAPAQVTITVIDTNNPPTIVEQQLMTKKNRPLQITPEAKDLDKDPVTFEITTYPAHGSATWRDDRLQYTPALNYSGPDSFFVRASDGINWSSEGEISIQVIATNAVPVALDSSVTVAPDRTSVVTLSGADPDGDPIAFSILADPLHGTITGEPPLLAYTPYTGYQGPDRISFKVADVESESEVGVLDLQVIRQNSPPEAFDLALSVPVNHPFLVPLSLSDADADPIQTIILKGPSKGILYGSGTNFTYSPAAGAAGADQFTIKGWDGQRFGNVATVTITLNSRTDPLPAFLTLTLKTPDEVELKLSVQTDNPVQIESSTNLLDWEAVSAILWPSGGETIFRDTNSPARVKFYRAITLE